MQSQRPQIKKGFIKSTQNSRDNTFQRNNEPGTNNENSKARENNTAIQSTGFTYLKFKDKSVIETKRKQGSKNWKFIKDTDLSDFFNECYSILKKHPNFVDDKIWTGKETSWDVANWINEEFKKVASYPHYELHRNDYDDNKLFWTSYIPINHDEKQSTISMCWLPYMKKVCKPIHDIVVDMIALLQKKLYIDLWNTQWEDLAMDVLSDDISECWDRWDEEKRKFEIDCFKQYFTSSTATILKKWFKGFKGFSNLEENKPGVAVEYLELIRKRSKTVTLNSLRSRVYRFKPESYAEEHIIEWVKKSFYLIRHGYSIGRHEFVPNEEANYGERPILPSDYLRFAWSFWDRMSSIWESWMNDTYNSFGSHPMYQFECINSKEYSINKGKIVPIKIVEFFHFGHSVFWDSIVPYLGDEFTLEVVESEGYTEYY